MNKWLKTMWHWLRQRIGAATPARSSQVQVLSVRPLNPGRGSSAPHVGSCPQLPSPSTGAVTVPVEVIPAGSARPTNRGQQTEKSNSGHVDRHQLVIRSLDPTKPIDTNVETWERRGNSFLVNQASTRILTGNQSLVSPQQITGLCNRCGGADNEFFICCRTGIQLCRGCVCFFPHRRGPIPVSMEAARALRMHLNGWELHDLEFGLMEDRDLSQIFPFLPRTASQFSGNAYS